MLQRRLSIRASARWRYPMRLQVTAALRAARAAALSRR